ncbi:MAG TPA: Gfo/Idh/MocA family oxidoreductase [Candidatus Cybelea sp.]|jgi:predicted dehydrogenase|nr:Gfo/Idh/MocA family oxidoreductase [Candidatus Cybelea sp.]
MAKKPLGIAVVGAGYWGPNLVRNFYASEEWSVRCVVERDRERLDRLLRLYPTVEGHPSIETALADPRVDAVALATPPRTHHELAARALEAGKHVLVEKPLAESFRDAQDLCDRARRAGLRLMTDHTFLYTGSVEKLRALRDSGELGSIYYVDSIRVNLGLFQQSNVVWDLAPHDVSILNYVLDELPASVALQLGACVHAKVPDVAFLTMWYPSGCLAHVHLSWLSPVKLRRTMISGSRKMAVWDDVEPTEKIYVYDKGVVLDPSSSTLQQQMVSYRLGDVHVPLVDNREALGKLIADFAAAIVDDSPTRSDGAFGAGVVRVIEAALRSAELDGAKVEV